MLIRTDEAISSDLAWRFGTPRTDIQRIEVKVVEAGCGDTTAPKCLRILERIEPTGDLYVKKRQK
jgi:hypothetical protein